MVPEFFQFHSPVKVVYGAGLIEDLSIEFETLKIHRVFMVSDSRLEEAGIVERVRKGIEGSDAEVSGIFLDVPQDSDVKTVAEVARQAKESGAEGLIALGGGSVIDTAKAANIVFSEGGSLLDDYSGAGILTRPLKPLIAVPTTSGTGSESTLVAVIYDSENRTKLAFSDRYLLPSLAILDPELTVSLPPSLTASTGMDALTHAVEATISIDWSPVSRALAMGAIDLIFGNIERATENGDDLEARGAMLIAANMAGTAFSHSMVGVVHSLAHAAGGLYRVPHGIANAILLPCGMAYNFEEGKDVFARMTGIMGVEVSGLDIDQAAEKVIEAVRNLTGRLGKISGMPTRLRDAGVPEEGLALIAGHAMEDGTSIYNPRELVEEELLAQLRTAY